MLSVWSNLEPRRQLIVAAATLAMFAAVLFLARGASQKDLTLLFGGLEPSVAGEIITALDQRGATYQIRSNAIYVEASQRDSLRMSLAGEGLPANGVKGYELLDGLSGFGTTSQMFDAAYWRAKEGELARTILANPAIRSARVHISTPNGSPFQRRNDPTAAVTVTTESGTLNSRQIKALQYLVGSAVSGLVPLDVAIIDDVGGLLSESGQPSSSATTDELTDRLRNQAERLLFARVGHGNAIVEVSVETINQSESIMERTVDPESRIAVSTDITESNGSSQDSGSGDVSVASNLPAGDAAGGGGSSQNETSETRALTNFEISEIQRQIVREPGDVRRLSVAVLINEVASGSGEETVFEPRTQEELAALEELVSSAVGLNAARGDVITLRSLPFEPIPVLGTELSSAPTTLPINVMQLAQVAILGIVAIILGLFVVRPILSGGAAGSLDALPAPDVFEGNEDFGGFEMNSDPMMFDAIDSPQFDSGGSDGEAVDRLREMIADREQETIQILQDWIEEPKRRETV